MHPLWPVGWPHPHFLFEALAYLVGFRLLLWMRKREGDAIDTPGRAWVLAAGAVGAAIGSKVLFLLEDPAATLANLSNPSYLIPGKTIVGGLLGGLAGVELAKRPLGIARSTGDLFVTPLIVGMILGRVGCFLSGVTDGTHGVPTSLPWGMDLGDGVIRHPTALYEIVFLAALWPFTRRKPTIEGDSFKLFLGGYLGFRLVVEFWKTQPFPYGGLSAIQVACVLGLAYYGWVLRGRTGH